MRDFLTTVRAFLSFLLLH